MVDIKEKLKQMILKKPKQEKKVPFLGSYLRKQTEKNKLGILEERYPKGFIFKTKEGQYEYVPQRKKKPDTKSKIQLVPLPQQERTFRPKEWGRQKPSLI